MSTATLEIVWCTAIGSALLGLCGLPQAIKAWRDPSSTRGLSWGLLIPWALGEWFMYAGLFRVASWPVLANYAFNLLLVCYIAGVKFVT